MLTKIEVNGAFKTRDRMDERQRAYGVKVRDNLCAEAERGMAQIANAALVKNEVGTHSPRVRDQFRIAEDVFEDAVCRVERGALAEISLMVSGVNASGKHESRSFVREL